MFFVQIYVNLHSEIKLRFRTSYCNCAMAVKIRLARGGKKRKPYYFITVADARASRDGRFIERIGSYNPNTEPATVQIETERALHWLDCGAVPTDTVRNLLSDYGVLLKKHLQKGVAKAALTQEQADAKFQAWKTEKDAKDAKQLQAKQNQAELNKKNALAQEVAYNHKRAEAIAKKQQAATVVETPATDEPAQEATTQE